MMPIGTILLICFILALIGACICVLNPELHNELMEWLKPVQGENVC